MDMQPRARIPLATYRLQFNRTFTFRDAARIVPYLHALGVSDIYSSPYFRARQGSPHGYDIVDHNTFNPEVGGEEDYRALVAELKRYGMGQLLDIVPNHMSVESADNNWWFDVLENGRTSPYARYFAIDWNPVKKELAGKVLLPILGDQYGRVLDDQQLTLVFREGAFFVTYFDHVFPLVPKSYEFVLGQRTTELFERLGEDHPDTVELLSIMTALKHLPSYLETDTATIEERNREKEVIKRRLNTLYLNSPAVRSHIDETIRIFNGTKGDPRSFDLLDELMNQQIYRLSHWRVATEEINYRRFFDVNGLAAIRMELPEVFEAAHRLVFRLVEEGSVTGLRVDHPDGLYDPAEYFRRLQRCCFLLQVLGRQKEDDPPADAAIETEEDDPPAAPAVVTEKEIAGRYEQMLREQPDYKPFYIVGEKILTKSERMPSDWPLFSTTGYVFLNSVNGIFVEGDNAKLFDVLYEKFIREKTSFADIIYEKKKLVMHVAMGGEVNTLGRYLNDLSEKNRHTRDFTLNSLRSAIIEVVAAFPVYRTYISSYSVTDRDAQYIEHAVSRAKRTNPAISGSIFDFLRDVLLLHLPEGCGEEDKAAWLDFVMRFQQFTGPVMAKGVEDTALCVYNRLVSLNEVGGMPDRFGTPLETFHGQNMERIKNWPHALITTATHDTKRSEGVRSRIDVLSEMPREWGKEVRNWAALNTKKKTVVNGEKAPDRNDEFLLYQTLVGAWPVRPEEGRSPEFAKRIREYLLKESREAKVNTSWINPNTAYEEALLAFIDAILADTPANQFLKAFLPFQKAISRFGMYNSLSQALLKICSPGVPDFYQGTELWDFSLVDPDNRRPVDYDRRIASLRELQDMEAGVDPLEVCRRLTSTMQDGRILQYVIYKLLNFRNGNRRVFHEGEYIALQADGARSPNICAFQRKSGSASIIAAVPRFLSGILSGPDALPFGPAVWEDSNLLLTGSENGTLFREVFTGRELVSAFCGKGKTGIALSEIFSHFPVALLEQAER